MKYQCPFCESFDVKRNDVGEVVCFSCFSVCSESIDDMLWGRINETPPPFPEELERRKTKRSTRSQRGSSDLNIIRRIV